MTILQQSGGHGDPVEMYAWIAVDENGKAGICGCVFDGNELATPLVGMTKEDAEHFIGVVEQIKAQSEHSTIELQRFVTAEDVRLIVEREEKTYGYEYKDELLKQLLSLHDRDHIVDLLLNHREAVSETFNLNVDHCAIVLTDALEKRDAGAT